MAVKKTMRDFSLWTSASGVPHIGRAQSTCMKAFWLIIFIACTIMFVYQMWVMIVTFLQYDVIVSTKLKFETLPFPAVTICNLNPYKKTAINERQAGTTKDLDDLIKDYKKAVARNFSQNDRWGFIELNDTMAIQARAREHMMYIVTNMKDQDTKTAITYNYDEFIKGCAFESKQCTRDDFTRLPYDPTYGQCWSFNYLKNQTRPGRKAGHSYGLRVLVVTDLEEYLEVTESAGVRVTVTGQEDNVFPDAFGYNAAAGFMTSFGLQFVETTRLDGVYGNCRKEDSTKYSVEKCFRNCLQTHLVKKCKCCDPSFPCDPPNTLCTNDLGTMKCIADATGSGGGSKAVSSGNFDAAKDCNCPELCKEAAYSFTVSSGNWPSQAYVAPYCTEQFASNKTGNKSAMAWCEENTMMIEVFYERMNYQSMTESEAYGIEMLIADFGGQIGLWIGVSFITVIEFIIFPCLVCAACCGNKGNQKHHAGDRYDEEDNEFDKIGGANSVEPAPMHPGNNAFNSKTPYDNHPTGKHDPYAGNTQFDMPPPVAR